MTLALTIGLEFEAHRIAGVDVRDQEYNRVLRNEKAARVIKELGLQDIFPRSTCHFASMYNPKASG
jgi:hypothetical protein